MAENKEHLVKKPNETRNKPDIFQEHQKFCIWKNIRRKQAIEFQKPCGITDVNIVRKTVSTDKREKIHKYNIKIPQQKTYSFEQNKI